MTQEQTIWFLILLATYAIVGGGIGLFEMFEYRDESLKSARHFKHK